MMKAITRKILLPPWLITIIQHTMLMSMFSLMKPLTQVTVLLN